MTLAAASFTGDDAALLGAVVVLLVVAAFLALAETGLVRMSRARARSLEEQHLRGARTLAQLVEDPEGFLAPVLLLVAICQLVAATLVGVVAARLYGALGVTLVTVFEVVVIFVAAEAVPKNWAVRHPDRAALIAAPAVRWLTAFLPIRLMSSALIGIARLVLRERGPSPSPSVTESELLAMADVAVESDVLEADERTLFSHVIDFGDTVVREVMTPRPDVVAVSTEATVAAALDKALEENRSRLPVFEATVDDIVGVVHALDLAERIRDGGADRPVTEAMRPAYYVPESKRVAPLMREMQAAHVQLAVVVDEYGGTAGVVTIEDLIEELVGEIADELDAEEPLVHQLDGGYLLSGKVGIDEAEELLGEVLPEGDFDTVAGMLLHLFGRVPAEGAAVDVGPWRFTADRVHGQRIGSVRVERVGAEAEAGA